MTLNSILSPVFTKLLFAWKCGRGRGWFGTTYDGSFLLVCICFALLGGSTVYAQGQSGAGLPTDPPRSVLPELRVPPIESENALLAQARTEVQAGSLSNAEITVKKYLSQNDASADGHYLLGYILSREVKAKESLAEYTRAAQLRPPTANDLKMVAVDYVLLNDFSDADRWLTKALEWNPSDADGWYYLGRTKYNENRFSEAIDAFQRCLVLDPHNVKAEDNLGLSYEGLNETQKALLAFQTAIAWQADGSRKDAQPYLNLGMLLAEQEPSDAALVYLQKAVALAPHNAKAHEQLGRAYLKLKRLKDAQVELEKAVQLAPNSSSLHFELGINYRDQGLKDQAKREFDRCAELNANHSSVDTPNE